MTDNARSEITQILHSLAQEGASPGRVTDRLFEAVYGELYRIAAGLMQGERADHTLEPTALVNETYLRLVDDTGIAWQGRAHFFGIAAAAMRRILVEHARRHAARKRGGGWERVTLAEEIGKTDFTAVEMLDLDRAIARLAAMDPRAARVVELRLFAGLSVKEIAHLLQVSERTVFDDWRVGKMYLSRALAEGSAA
jgi:RNA polymerase sigma factor (TIGR02999 family)